ncbi:hypothetical protein S83_039482 [Arachis hypogaea]
MCHGRRMFTLMKIWRRNINVDHKRYVVIFAVAALAIPLLVITRSHCINTVPNLPLVVSDDAEVVEKTKEIINVLRSTQFTLGRKKCVTRDTFQEGTSYCVRNRMI